MAHAKRTELDLTRELRLRNWARRNYVPERDRKSTWHPIVLDEMSRRDAELKTAAWQHQAVPAYVPLMPGQTAIVHPAHPQTREPKLLRQMEESPGYVLG